MHLHVSSPPSQASQHFELDIHVRGSEILATRGAQTDSFVRCLLIGHNFLEAELGHTEVVMGSLSPVFKTSLPLRFRKDAAEGGPILKFEICDPGDQRSFAGGALSALQAATLSGATVIGVAFISLYEMARFARGAGSSR